MWQTISQGEVWHGLIRNRKKDGGYYWVESTIVPFLDAEGIPYQYVSVRTDVTPIKEAEASLKLENDKREETVAELSELNSELARSEQSLQQQMQELARRYQHSVKEASEAVLKKADVVTDFAKLGHRIEALREENEVLRNQLSEYTRLIEQANVGIAEVIDLNREV